MGKESVDILQRIRDYKEPWCYQYDIRKKKLSEDLLNLNMTEEDISKLRISDFEFRNVTDKNEQRLMTQFIERYEWLGNISQFPTHWFGAYYNDILAGVVIMNMPNAFSKLLGEDTKLLERLISRGACASWTPKNLASAMLAWSMKWMVNNTQYRLFTCYSDPQAKECGTIYQALNAYYLGCSSGTVTRCINPYTGKIVSDRVFRARSFYKRYAKELGIEWQKNWNNDQSMLWENIPNDIEQKLRDFSKQKYKESEKITFPSKHKYAFVLGKDKRETKQLKKLFLSRNKVYPYPKVRGV